MRTAARLSVPQGQLVREVTGSASQVDTVLVNGGYQPVMEMQVRGGGVLSRGSARAAAAEAAHAWVVREVSGSASRVDTVLNSGSY